MTNALAYYITDIIIVFYIVAHWYQLYKTCYNFAELLGGSFVLPATPTLVTSIIQCPLLALKYWSMLASINYECKKFCCNRPLGLTIH
jgi:hypothetical protein